METTPRPSISRKWIVVLVLAFVSLSVVMPLVRRSGELKVYTKAAGRLVQGEQIYRTDDRAPFAYPALFALPFVPLLALPPMVQRSVWWFINLTLLASIIWIVTNMVWPVVCRGRNAGRAPVWQSVVVTAVLSGRFLLSPLEYECHNLMLLALIAVGAAALAHGRDKTGGVCTALATAFKATPLLFLPFFIWQRRWGATAVFVLVLGLATLLPDVMFPNRDGGLWIASWHEHFVSKVGVAEAADAEGTWKSWSALNQSLPGTLYRLSTVVTPNRDRVNVALWELDGRPLKVLTLGLELAVVAFLAWITWHGRLQSVQDSVRPYFVLGQTGAVLCCMLLLSPMSSSQHFCALLFPITFCVTYWMHCRRSRTIGAALLVIFVFGTLGAQDIVGSYWSDRLQAFGAATFCTITCLLASGYILVRESRITTSGAQHWQPPVRESLSTPARAA